MPRSTPASEVAVQQTPEELWETATAYFVLNSAVHAGQYFDEDTIEWAKSRMTGEQRTGMQLLNEARGVVPE